MRFEQAISNRKIANVYLLFQGYVTPSKPSECFASNEYSIAFHVLFRAPSDPFLSPNWWSDRCHYGGVARVSARSAFLFLDSIFRDSEALQDAGRTIANWKRAPVMDAHCLVDAIISRQTTLQLSTPFDLFQRQRVFLSARPCDTSMRWKMIYVAPTWWRGRPRSQRRRQVTGQSNAVPTFEIPHSACVCVCVCVCARARPTSRPPNIPPTRSPSRKQ